MNSLILYLLESSIILAFLYGLYLLLLRKETFFNFNRFFLIAILAFSFLIPLVNIDISTSGNSLINEQISEFGKARNNYYTTVENWSVPNLGSSEIESSRWQQFWAEDWNILKSLIVSVGFIYFVGLFFLVIRLALAYLKIFGLKKKLSFTNLSGLNVATIPSHMAPFSFLNTVFMPDHIKNKDEFDQILAHEKTHIRQKHSIDLIIVQQVAVFIWFNPVIWLLIKSLKQTHEYIADKNMLKQGFSLVEYQSLLLRQLISNNSYGLVHYFNLSFTKKRITMMSIKESGLTGKSKVVFVLFITLFVGMMTAQSNTRLDIPSLGNEDSPVGNKMEMKFYIDGILINDGLKFSKAKNSKGEFSFKVNNDQKDNIHVALQLIRVGQTIDHIDGKLQEGNSLRVSQLLRKAKLDDYVVIDIIEGPSEVAKLYNFPLFKESENWKKDQNNDLPPPPIKLFVNNVSVDSQNGIPFSDLRGKGAKLEYVLSEFMDFEIFAKQGGDVTVALVRKGKEIRSIVSSGIKPKKLINLGSLLNVAEKGDDIVVQIGNPKGLQTGSRFTLQ